MENCLACGKTFEASTFGNYCCKDCRDSELAILGRTFTCTKCGNDFKSLSRASLCVNCSKETVTSVKDSSPERSSISEFKYSIFEDNIQRIVDASSRGDKRNCIHAVQVISETIDSSLLPEIQQLMNTSNKKAQIWFIEIMARLKDKKAIEHLERCLNNADDEVQSKALEAINLLRNCG